MGPLDTALSSTVAELYAMAQAVKEGCLRMWVAEEMHIVVEWPMIRHINNAAGESFEHSTCGSSHLKGIFNLCAEWVKELKNEGIVNGIVKPVHHHRACADQ